MTKVKKNFGMFILSFFGYHLLAVFSIGLFVFPVVVQAQTAEISGKVLDSKTRQALSSVSIRLKSTGQVIAITDSSGKFCLKNFSVPATLHFSLIGYKTTDTEILTRKAITVFLEEDNKLIGDVDVYGNVKSHQEEFLEVPVSASGIQLVTAREIEVLRPKDVYDLLQTTLGLTISRQGSRINNWVSGRGAGNNSMGIILDGVFLSSNEATRILGDLSLGVIESLRIVRDASLVTLGPVSSGNSGSPNQGFIIITTKNGKETLGTQVTASYGTWNTIEANIFHGEAISDKINFGVGYAKSKNDDKVDKLGNWNNANDGNLFWTNLNYTGNKVMFKGSFLYNHAKRDIQRYQEADGTWGTAAWSYDPRNTLHGGLDISVLWNNQHTTEVSFGISRDDGKGWYHSTSRTDYFIDTLIVAAPREFKDRASTANILHTYSTNRNTLKAGSQMIYNYQLTEGRTTPGSNYKFGFYASDEFKLISGLTVDGGARLDKLYIKEGTEKYTDDGVTTKTKSHMWDNDAWTVSFGANWSQLSLLSVSARTSMTKTPTPSSMSTKNNESLPDEEWTKFEMGTVFSLCNELKFNVTGYYYDVKNAKTQAVDDAGNYLTLTTTDGDVITVYDATQKLSRKGFEAMVEGAVLKYFNYNIGYSYFSSSLASEDTTMARYKLTGKINLHKDNFGADLSMVRVPQYWSNNAEVGDYTLWNANVSLDVSEMMRVSMFARNLTDQKYATRYKGVGSGYFYDIGAVYGIELRLRL